VLPHIGKIETMFDFLIHHHPFVLLDFAKDFCEKNTQQWNMLANQLFELLQDPVKRQSLAFVPENPDSTHDQQANEIIACIYTSLLDFLASKLASNDFIQLLPNDGHLGFFLPFIESSLRNQDSHQLIRNIL